MSSHWELRKPWEEQRWLADDLSDDEKTLLRPDEHEARARTRITSTGLVSLKNKGGRPAHNGRKRQRASQDTDSNEEVVRALVTNSTLQSVRALADDKEAKWVFNVDQAARLATAATAATHRDVYRRQDRAKFDIFHTAFFRGNRPTLSREVIFLADHTLKDLAAFIQCPSLGEPDADHGPEAFFIDNVFYNETKADQQDLSKTIESYLEAKRSLPRDNGSAGNEQDIGNAGLEKFCPPATQSCHGFGNYTLRSLPLKFEVPYVFIHRGSCEHLFVFIDFRQSNPYCDPVNAVNYPHVSRCFTPNRHKCEVCDVCFASKMVDNDSIASESPMLYCEDCFEKLHCDDRGRLVDSSLHISDIS